MWRPLISLDTAATPCCCLYLPRSREVSLRHVRITVKWWGKERFGSIGTGFIPDSYTRQIGLRFNRWDGWFSSLKPNKETKAVAARVCPCSRDTYHLIQDTIAAFQHHARDYIAMREVLYISVFTFHGVLILCYYLKTLNTMQLWVFIVPTNHLF